MRGTINCNKCGRVMHEPVCSCGRGRCHIEIYWKRKAPYKFYRTKQRVFYSFDSAVADLILINEQIVKEKFYPGEWQTGKAEEWKVKKILALWLADKDQEVEKGKRSPGGIAPYHSYAKKHYLPYFGEMNIRDVDKNVVRKFYKFLEKQNLKHKSQKNIVDGFHTFLEWALDSEENYISAVPPFPTVSVADAVPRRTIDEETQQQALLRIPEKYRAPFIVMFDMCLRVGETVAFQIKDYVPELKAIWIRRTESKNRIKENTKANIKTCMKLTDDALRVVKECIRGRYSDKYLDDWLFVNPDTHRRYPVSGLEKIWEKYSGLDVGLYEAGRHSSLTHLAYTGDAYLIRDAGRHSDIRTSQRYVGRMQDKLYQAMNRRKSHAKEEEDTKRIRDGLVG